MSRLYRLTGFICVLTLTSAYAGVSVDKSGVKPQVISLPKGPGSIEGLGESFEPQLNSGTTAYAIKLDTPPGRAGLEPELTLRYNAGNPNSILGLGWSLSGQYLQRQTDKGLPTYTDADTFIENGGEELVPVDDGTYRPENESAFTRYLRQGEGWRGEGKSGLVYTYGLTPQGRVQSGDKVFRWLLEAITDRNGNTIRYTYASLDTGPQRYCESIIYSEYKGKCQEITFEYEARADGLPDYRPTFRLETAWRLKSVSMKSAGQLVRRYDFDYVSDSKVTLLAKVTQFGSDGVSSLPPAVFTYTAFDPAQARLVSMEQPNNEENGPWVIMAAEPDAALNDMNGDGLTDLLVARPGDHQVYLNLGVGDDGVHRWSSRIEMNDASPGEALGNKGASLADIDGDGRTDFIARRAVDTYYWWRNLGSGLWDMSQTFADNSGLPFDFENTNVQLVDINNDKHIDVMYCNESSGEYYTYLINNGALEFAAPISKEGLNRGMTFSAGMKLADMNGDRLQDIVWIKDGIFKYWPSSGVGEWDLTRLGDWNTDEYGDGTKMFNPPDSEHDGEPSLESSYRSLMLVDVNGDGLTDALYVPEGAERIMYWLNRDSLNFDGPFQVTGTPTKVAGTAVQPADMNGNGTTDILWNYSDQARVIANSIIDGTAGNHSEYDMNGDGRIDVADVVAATENPKRAGHVKSMSPNMWQYMEFCPEEKPYLLKTVTNGIGRKITFHYTTTAQEYVRDRVSRPWPTGVPNAATVLASYEEDDGQAHVYRVEFRYHDGYYDGKEKEFRGFAAAEKREIGDAQAPGLVSAFTFDTGRDHEVLKGKPLTMEVAEDGVEGAPGAFYRETYTWNPRLLLKEMGVGTRSVHTAEQLEKVRDVIEQGNGTPVIMKWEYEYDEYGNMTRQVEHGRLDGAWNDERITETTYSGNYADGKDLWILDKVVENTTKDGAGKIVAQKLNFYDGQTALGKLVKGNLTRVDDRVSETETITSVQNDYDSFGNIITIKDALYSGGQSHYRDIIYDDTFQTFPVMEIIYTGDAEVSALEMRATYDAGQDVMTSSTEFNGFTTTYGYDKFGRLTEIIKPPDVAATVSYDYERNHLLPDGRIINWVSTYQHDGMGGTLKSRTFYDGLGRKIMTRTDGEDSGQIIVTDTVIFNARKQPDRKYLPYSESGTLDFVDPTYRTGFTQHRYDALGREVQMTQPDQTFSTTTYAPMAKLIQDEEQTNPASPHYNCGMRYVEDGLWDKDGKGRLREVYEIVRLTDVGEPLNTPVEWLTQYAYDTLDNLTGYVDSRGNQKLIVYDALSRKTFMDDPDRGQMTYLYDAAGNLQQTIDAKGQIIRYEYDGVNRLSAEYYGKAAMPAVEYHYDAPAGPVDRGELYPGTETAMNVKGYLAWVRDQSGEEHNSYDARGRVEWTIKRIQDTGPDDLRNFYTGYDYDSMDRVTTLTYPDQTTVSYTYNARGLLEAIPNVVTRVDYNPAGQNARLDYACGTSTTYDYDTRLRLSRLRTVRQRDGVTLQDLNYSYDGVSNITAITDGRSENDYQVIGNELGITLEESKKFDNTQAFQYDSLYRLTQSSNPTVYGTITHRYDPIGNMVQQIADLNDPDPVMNLGTMTSGGTGGISDRIGRGPTDPPGPHAITSTEKGPDGAMAFTYDKNGNMLTDGSMTLDWDIKDRLTGVSKGISNTQHFYDHTGTRKKKLISIGSTASEVFYIDKYSEVRGGALKKYVYAARNRVAVLKSGSTAEVHLYYLHDHVGSTAFYISPNTVCQGEFVNFAFGSPRMEVAAESLIYGFSGKEKEQESNLRYFGTRFQGDFIAGRFLSVDAAMMQIVSTDSIVGGLPSLKPLNLNCYAYASGNPIKFNDQTGESATLCLGVGGGIIGGFSGLVSGLMTGASGKDLVAKVVGGAVGGAVAGAMVGFAIDTGGTALAAYAAVGANPVVSGGVSSAIGTLAENVTGSLLQGKGLGTFDSAFKGVGNATLTGAALGKTGDIIAKPLAGLLNRSANEAIKSAKNLLLSGINATNPQIRSFIRENAQSALKTAQESIKATEYVVENIIGSALGVASDKAKLNDQTGKLLGN